MARNRLRSTVIASDLLGVDASDADHRVNEGALADRAACDAAAQQQRRCVDRAAAEDDDLRLD
jgi:hypothetical protein